MTRDQSMRQRCGLLLTAALAGCTVGPDFHRPASPPQSGYLAPGEAAPAAATTGQTPASWWTLYGSA
jgi:outer membrane protein TolC